MLESEKRQFYAQTNKKLTTINMSGKKVSFANLPENMQKEIKEKLAEKDPVMKKALETTKFGVKIDGIEVSRGNIHQFEIKKPIEIPKIVEPIKVVPKVVPKVEVVKAAKKVKTK